MHERFPKRTIGRPSTFGAAVTINPGQPKVLVAEGPETGLSLAQANPQATVMIALSASNFNNLKFSSHQKEIIICMDNDGDNTGSCKAVVKAASAYSRNGHQVYLTMPDKNPEVSKWDFNDVLKYQGEENIRVKLEQAVLFRDQHSDHELKHITEFTNYYLMANQNMNTELKEISEQLTHQTISINSFEMVTNKILNEIKNESISEIKFDECKEMMNELKPCSLDEFSGDLDIG